MVFSVLCVLVMLSVVCVWCLFVVVLFDSCVVCEVVVWVVMWCS